jgi:RNA polymerase sigma-70 factor, ECF subfamily
MVIGSQIPGGTGDAAPPPAEPAGEVEVAALARGEAMAIEALCRELLDPVHAFVFWRVGGNRQDAEDVTQEAFLTALRTLDRFEGRSSLYTWICGIARNLAHERVRSLSRKPPPAGDPETGPAPDQLLEHAETERLVGLALTELAPHYQRALLDKYVDQRSFAEMASAQRSTAKAIESLVQRAKRALGEALARAGLTSPDGEAK